MITLQELGKTLRASAPIGCGLLTEQFTGYRISTCYAIDKDGVTLGRIVTARKDVDPLTVSVKGRPRVFKTLDAVEKALRSIDVIEFTVYMT